LAVGKLLKMILSVFESGGGFAKGTVSAKRGEANSKM